MPNVGREAAVMMAELEAQAKYKPRHWAERLMASYQQRGVAVIHRRGSKSTSFFHYALRAARNDTWEAERLRHVAPALTKADIAELLQGRQYAHILPTLAQAKLTVWPIVKRYTSGMPGVRHSESDAAVIIAPTTRNPLGARIQLFGADDPKQVDRLRGYACWGVNYDEFSQIDETLHSTVISKSLADHYGFAFWFGTLKGKNQLFRYYEANKADPAWFTLWQDIDESLRTEQGPTVRALEHAMKMDRDEIAKGLMTQEEYDQEWYLSTVAAVRGGYYVKQIGQATRERRITGLVPYDPALPVHDVWDLGVGPQLVVGAFQRDRIANQLRLIETFSGSEHDGIPEMVARLKGTHYVWGKHFAPHDIKTTEKGSGKRTIDLASEIGWKFELVRDIGVDNGITRAKALWPRLWVDEQKCRGFLDLIGLYRQRYDEQNRVLTGVPVKDQSCHYADMLRYAAIAEEDMVLDTPVTVPAVPVATVHPSLGGSGWMR